MSHTSAELLVMSIFLGCTPRCFQHLPITTSKAASTYSVYKYTYSNTGVFIRAAPRISIPKWVPVSSVFHNKIPKMRGLTQQKFSFSQFWKLGSARPKFQHGQVRALFLGVDHCLLIVSSHGTDKESKFSCVSCYEVNNSAQIRILLLWFPPTPNFYQSPHLQML